MKRIGNTIAALFVLASLLAMFALVGGREAWYWLSARQWVETTCTVRYARLDTSEGADNEKSYAVGTSYDYKDEADVYSGWRYDFSVGAGSSEYGPAARAVRYLNSNSTVPCFYNSRKPEQSVIDRGFHASMLFALIPGVFLIMFGFWIAQVFKVRSKPKRRLP